MTGYAVAGGLELSLWCDLRVAERSAKFGVFCRRFGNAEIYHHNNSFYGNCSIAKGVPLIDGGTVRLPMMIGLSHALDLILTGREVSAEEGLRIGYPIDSLNHLECIKEDIYLCLKN